jgi:hypothetical protein
MSMAMWRNQRRVSSIWLFEIMASISDNENNGVTIMSAIKLGVINNEENGGVKENRRKRNG